MCATLIIGDIHGCHVELQALLDIAAVPDDVQLVSLGDMVDRGPHSLEVLTVFRDRFGAQAVCGNHERKHLRAARGELRPALSQRITRRQLGEEGYATALAFMDTLPLHLDLGEVVAVHGFWEPGVPLEEQNPMVLAGTMGGERLLLERWGSEWYKHYDGDKPLVVGHHNYLGSGAPLVWRDRVFGLDTSCVHGMRLTGLVLPEFRLVSVPARQNHWAVTKQLYAEQSEQGQEISRLTWADAHRLFERAEEQESLPAHVKERLQALEDSLLLAEALLVRLHLALMKELDVLLVEARGGEGEDADAKLEGRRFAGALARRAEASALADALGQRRYCALLHQARREGCSLERLRRSLRRPAQVLELGNALGWE